MSSEFLEQQCKLIEETFYGGAEDPELRAMIETIPEESDTSSDTSSDSEKEGATDSEEEDEFQGGAITLDAAPQSIPFGTEYQSQNVKEFEPEYQPQNLKEFETQFDKLQTDFEQFEADEFDNDVQALEIKQLEAVEAQAQQDMDAKIDLVEDPVWIRGGVQYLDEFQKKVERFSRDKIIRQVHLSPVDSDGKLIPCENTLAGSIAWMDRLLIYFRSKNWDTVELEELSEFYQDCVNNIQHNAALSMMPIRLEWVQFQEYVMGRLA